MTVRTFYHFFGPMHASIYGQHFFWQAVSHDSIKDEQKSYLQGIFMSSKIRYRIETIKK